MRWSIFALGRAAFNLFWGRNYDLLGFRWAKLAGVFNEGELGV
jgi:hypothetical protein